MSSNQVQTWIFILKNLNATSIVDQFLSTIISSEIIFMTSFHTFFLFSIDIVWEVHNQRHVYIFIWVTSHIREKKALLTLVSWFNVKTNGRPFSCSLAGDRIPESRVPRLLYAICSWGVQKEYHGNCVTVDPWRNNEKSEVIHMTNFSHHHGRCQLYNQAMVWRHHHFKALLGFPKRSACPTFNKRRCWSSFSSLVFVPWDKCLLHFWASVTVQQSASVCASIW